MVIHTQYIFLFIECQELLIAYNHRKKHRTVYDKALRSGKETIVVLLRRILLRIHFSMLLISNKD